MTEVVHVATASPYDVTIGSGLTDAIVAGLPETAQRVLIIRSGRLAARGEVMRAAVEASGREVIEAVVPDAEAGKTICVAAFCWQVLGKSDFTRTDVVLGLGGGAVTDLAGFVAANWLRGVQVIQVPTSLAGNG